MLKPGDVVVTLFRYSDLSGAKYRPALVISSEEHNRTGHIVLAAVSSRPLVDYFDVPIQSWEEAGLRLPSKVRAGRILTVDARLVKKIGSITLGDFSRVKSALSEVLEIKHC